MEIKSYSPVYFDQCVGLFTSNFDKYFAEHELDEFKSFLDQVAPRSTYFVLLDKNEVVACGGYEKHQEEFILTWGMVKRELHGHGYGKTLTINRLNIIKSKYPDSNINIDTSQYSKGFYEKQGFKIQAIERDGYAPGLDKYSMSYEPTT